LSSTASSQRSPELPPGARDEIDALRPHYPTTRALLLPALHIVQRRSGGWLPETVIAAVADALELAPAEVYGVVTFYDLFHQRPVGRHRLRVCTNVSCMLRGSAGILRQLREELGVAEDEVTPDGRASYVSFECLGACDLAPVMMVDDGYRGQLTPAKVRQILGELE
jgi:NADH-quinone oxidoreductase subunit E